MRRPRLLPLLPVPALLTASGGSSDGGGSETSAAADETRARFVPGEIRLYAKASDAFFLGIGIGAADRVLDELADPRLTARSRKESRQ